MPKFILSHAKVQIWPSCYPLGPKKRNHQQKQQMRQSLMEQHFDKNQQQNNKCVNHRWNNTLRRFLHRMTFFLQENDGK